MTPSTLSHLLAVARGDAPADLLLTDCAVLDVFSGQLLRTELAIADGYVAGLGPREAERERSGGGGVLVPGFFDAHVHLESSMVTPDRFAGAVVPRGTTAVVTDAHEVANVHGAEGITWLLDATEGLPLDVFVMLPSCVPATPLETSGATLDAEALARFAGHPRVLGLGEVMNTPGLIGGDPDLLAKVLGSPGPVDGHAVGLTGRALQAYVAAGVHSDHEAIDLEGARERVRLGMRVMIREGTTERNLAELAPLLRGPEAWRCLLCTDDRHPHELLEVGHIDDMLRKAVAAGVDPAVAVRAASLGTAEYLGLPRRGALAPGHQADLVLVDDLERFRSRLVFKRGRLVAEDGVLQVPLPASPALPPRQQRLAWRGVEDLRIPAQPGEVRVIELLEDQVVTRAGRARPKVEGGLVVSDTKRDLLKLAVVERHRGTGRVGLGLTRGFGLQRGALASTVAHDSHNVVVVGTNDADMALAVEALVARGGGLAVVAEGEVRALLPLPVAGLMSPAPLAEVAQALVALNAAARALGCTLPAPFMTLSFLALPPIPALKLSDRGLVDVARFEHVPLFLEADRP